MSRQTELDKVHEKIDEFIEIVLLREKISCDRTWTYSLQRFFQYVFSKHGDILPNYNVEIINDYISHLQEKNKQPVTIANFIKAIIVYSQYLRKNINKDEIKAIKVEKEEHPYIDEEEDLFSIEKYLFEKIEQTLMKIDVSKEPTMSDLLKTPYDELRNNLQHYLMFRLVCETGINGDEIANLTLDCLQNDGYLNISNRNIPLLKTTFQLLQQYTAYRKKFDYWIYKQKVMKEVFIGKIPFGSIEKMNEFLQKEQDKKINEIENIVLEQISIEEKIQQLEEEGGQEDKIHLLEEEIDVLTEKNEQLKKIMVYERKLNDYMFSNYLFVSNQYKRLNEKDIIQMMERHSLPIVKLQNTVINKWEKEEINPKLVGQLIGSKYVSKNADPNYDELKKVVEAGFIFPERQFFHI